MENPLITLCNVIAPNPIYFFWDEVSADWESCSLLKWFLLGFMLSNFMSVTKEKKLKLLMLYIIFLRQYCLSHPHSSSLPFLLHWWVTLFWVSILHYLLLNGLFFKIFFIFIFFSIFSLVLNTPDMQITVFIWKLFNL